MNALYAHLHTGGRPAPWSYVRLVLCRDVYHCRPSELDAEPWAEVAEHLALLNVEARVQGHKNKAARALAAARSKG